MQRTRPSFSIVRHRRQTVRALRVPLGALILLDYHLPDVTAPSRLVRPSAHPALGEIPGLVLTLHPFARARTGRGRGIGPAAPACACRAFSMRPRDAIAARGSPPSSRGPAADAARRRVIRAGRKASSGGDRRRSVRLRSVGPPVLLDDQSRATREGEVRPRPLDQHDQTVAEPAQVVDVDQEPRHPGGKPSQSK